MAQADVVVILKNGQLVLLNWTDNWPITTHQPIWDGHSYIINKLVPVPKGDSISTPKRKLPKNARKAKRIRRRGSKRHGTS